MRRTWAAIAVCATVAGIPAAALAWAAGTHAYIAKHTAKKAGQVTEIELCRRALGANGPDLFNSIWEAEPQALANVLHMQDPGPNLAPWAVAQGDLQRAYAFGFASHNNGFGTDFVAHFAGRTFGKDEGYVIAKAEIVGAVLAQPIGEALGLPPDLALALAVAASHNFVEFGVDFLLAQADPGLGATLLASAGCYAGQDDNDFLLEALGPYFGPVLSDDPDEGLAMAKAWIDNVYPQFVAGLGANGWVLSQPPEVGKPLIAQQMAVEAIAYLAYNFPGLIDPPPTPEDLVPLMSAGLDVAMAACAPDIMREMAATIGWVNGRMSSKRISP